MKVRNKLLSKGEYGGREAEASDEACPCRPCFNIHDCGYTHTQGRWVRRMYCLTNWKQGCPSPLPEPQHIVVSRRAEHCRRCGVWLTREQVLAATLLSELETISKGEM